jgi:hypothetical protein
LKGKFILGQFHPQQRWRLKDGAAPKHLLGNNVHKQCAIGLREFSNR